MPKIIGTTLAEHRTETRTRLFAALSALMERKNFDAITLSEIAAAAGIGRTAIYNHFPDKESLLVAFIDHETDAYLTTLSELLTDTTDPIDKIRLYVSRIFQLKQYYHFAPGPNLRQVVSNDTWRELHGHIRVVEQHLHAVLKEAIATGEIPEQDVTTSARLIHAVVTGRPAPVTEPERSDYIEAATTFVLRGLGYRGHTGADIAR